MRSARCPPKHRGLTRVLMHASHALHAAHALAQVVSALPGMALKGQPEAQLLGLQLADRLLQQEAEALKDVDSCCMPTSGG